LTTLEVILLNVFLIAIDARSTIFSCLDIKDNKENNRLRKEIYNISNKSCFKASSNI